MIISMKYVCTRNSAGHDQIFLFPKTIDHDVFASFLDNPPISAGFVTRKGGCFGSSMTLNLDSREQDTNILFSQYTQHDD